MTHIEILRGATYSLVSVGNGWAYELYSRPAIDTPLEDSPSVWFQDDGATTLREELADLERVYPGWSSDRVMQELWARYGERAELA